MVFRLTITVIAKKYWAVINTIKGIDLNIRNWNIKALPFYYLYHFRLSGLCNINMKKKNSPVLKGYVYDPCYNWLRGCYWSMRNSWWKTLPLTYLRFPSFFFAWHGEIHQIMTRAQGGVEGSVRLLLTNCPFLQLPQLPGRRYLIQTVPADLVDYNLPWESNPGAGAHQTQLREKILSRTFWSFVPLAQ